MNADFEYTIFSEEKIKERVIELGNSISSDYKGRSPLIIGVLKGSFIFLADLVRNIEQSCEIRFVGASSYGFDSNTSGDVKISKVFDFDVQNRDIIIVEDILDTGVTLSAMKKFIEELSPASVKICALLDKVSRRQTPISADYVGFICPDEFVVGYGLDYAERYRNLPYIAALKPEVYSKNL